LPSRAKQWGNVARRGAREVTRRDGDFDPSASGSLSASPRGARFPDERERRRGTAPPSRPSAWVRADGARDEWEDEAPAGTPGRTAKGKAEGTTKSAAEALAALSTRRTLPPEIAADIRNAADVATAQHRERLVERAESAYRAYERGRFQDALRAIKPVADEAPDVAAVRELAGLAAYRSGRWREATRHLNAYGARSDSTEHLPVLMDCQRALLKPKKVAELWGELRHSSPDPDVLAEGRIVAAASLADNGDLNGAIAMLATAGASKALRNPSDRHLRQWYLLADLYERAGDVPRAREYFERILRADPEAYDVADRLRGLGPERRGRSKAKPRPRAKSETRYIPKSKQP
jgi:tetratricopeptide (TPR) repeat protein